MKAAPLSPLARRALFAAGALTHHAGSFHAPLDRHARREFEDGRTLARQGFIRIVDARAARLEVEQLMQEVNDEQLSRRQHQR